MSSSRKLPIGSFLLNVSAQMSARSFIELQYDGDRLHVTTGEQPCTVDLVVTDSEIQVSFVPPLSVVQPDTWQLFLAAGLWSGFKCRYRYRADRTGQPPDLVDVFVEDAGLAFVSMKELFKEKVEPLVQAMLTKWLGGTVLAKGELPNGSAQLQGAYERIEAKVQKDHEQISEIQVRIRNSGKPLRGVSALSLGTLVESGARWHGDGLVPITEDVQVESPDGKGAFLIVAGSTLHLKLSAIWGQVPPHWQLSPAAERSTVGLPDRLIVTELEVTCKRQGAGGEPGFFRVMDNGVSGLAIAFDMIRIALKGNGCPDLSVHGLRFLAANPSDVHDYPDTVAGGAMAVAEAIRMRGTVTDEEKKLQSAHDNFHITRRKLFRGTLHGAEREEALAAVKKAMGDVLKERKQAREGWDDLAMILKEIVRGNPCLNSEELVWVQWLRDKGGLDQGLEPLMQDGLRQLFKRYRQQVGAAAQFIDLTLLYGGSDRCRHICYPIE